MTSLTKILAILIIGCCASLSAQAQFQTVYIGVNGMTCSQCTRSVEMSISKLDFVANVQMDLQHTEGTITLKSGAKADIDRVAQAIINAGFSVRYLKADLAIGNAVTISGPCIDYRSDRYILLSPPANPLQGTVKLTFIGRKYMPAKDFKKADTTPENHCGHVSGKVYTVALQ